MVIIEEGCIIGIGICFLLSDFRVNMLFCFLIRVNDCSLFINFVRFGRF